MDFTFQLGYDETSPQSIEAYAQKLRGKTFAEVLNDNQRNVPFIHESNEYGYSHENKNRKGGLGELIEESFFHYKCNNDSRPDFEKAGVELKVTPYKINKNGSLSAKERLIITMIDYMNVINESFKDSHFWAKAGLILLVYYLYQKEIENRLDYRIDYAQLFTPPEEDIAIMGQDFDVILGKVKAGKAHELSGSDTLYLEAAPKASTSADRRPQPFNSIPAKPRAFAFKSSYMTYVLNRFILPGKRTYEPIIKEEVSVPFEQYITDKINTYRNNTVDELCKEFSITFQKQPKNLEALLAYRMLGINGNHAEEFEKAGIVVKTIRISNKNTIKESMSFPTFKFKEIVEEDWDTSSFGNYLRDTRFFFVVYKYDENNILRLKGCQFWNIPYNDLEEEVKVVWERTKQVLADGLIINNVNGQNTSNLPKASENPVCHVRPHGRDSSDTYELPTDGLYPKQCFWLNNTYILSQLNQDFLA